MPNQTLTMVQAINLALRQEMAKDQTVLCYGEDVGVEGGVFRVTEGIQKEFGENRCFDAPVSEAGIIGTAIGLAINGMKPVIEMQFSGFAFEAFAQTMCHAAKMRNRSRGEFTVPLVMRMPVGGGIKALEHHSESEEGFFAQVPGIKVVVPSTPFDAKGLLIAAIRDPDPVIFMEPKRIYRAFKQEVPEEDYFIPLGKAAMFRMAPQGADGQPNPRPDVTLMAWGSMVRECMEAAAAAQKEGIFCEVVDVRSISPLDMETLTAAAARTGRVIIVHEAVRSFGPGAELAAALQEHLFGTLKKPVMRVTGYDVAFPLAKTEDMFIPDEKRVLAAVKQIMA